MANDEKQPGRVIGWAKGKIPLPDSFFEPLPDDMLRAFEGDEHDPQIRAVRSAELNHELERRLSSLDRGDSVDPENVRAKLQASTPRFEIDFLPEYTDDALLEEIRRVAALLPEGKVLTKPEFQRHSPRAASSTIGRRFGGWKQALERAGLGHLYHGQPVSDKMRSQPARELSNLDLIAELQRVHKVVGKGWLSSDDFNAHSISSEVAVRRRFGTFRKGLEVAGIASAPNKQRQFSDQECFENIAEVWTHYGRAPTYREMFSVPSAILGKTYVLRWGTWRKTLKAFVDWANSDDQPQEPSDDQNTTATIEVIPTEKRAEAECREVRPGLRFKVFMRDRFRCVACGRSPATDLNVILHADHVRPVALGGKTVIENLQTLCEGCNLGKGVIPG